jgi:hypothetical protein
VIAAAPPAKTSASPNALPAPIAASPHSKPLELAGSAITGAVKSATAPPGAFAPSRASIVPNSWPGAGIAGLCDM